MKPVITDVGKALPMDLSPDGQRVLFVGEPVGPPTGVDPDAPVGSLYVVGIDGSDLRRITPDGVYATSSARWSPDGEWIVGGGLAQSGDPIWVVRPDGSDWHVVYEDSDGWGLGCAIWSPDGKYILFCRNPPGSIATLSSAPPNGLYVMRADGTGATPVIVSDDWKRDVDWTATEWNGSNSSPG
jgi:Tol biopolymer transport system component